MGQRGEPGLPGAMGPPGPQGPNGLSLPGEPVSLPMLQNFNLLYMKKKPCVKGRMFLIYTVRQTPYISAHLC